jgi:orotidine-5'-phosphate decarboxylase
MTRQALFDFILRQRSFLCVGLDPDPDRLPHPLRGRPDGITVFNREIIAATKDLCVAYKPNLAFYEARGLQGWRELEQTRSLLPDSHFSIADANRGDIGNTATQYARAFFGNLDFDAITVAPYMGEDSVAPFLDFAGKWVILLALTSNPGSRDFQLSPQEDGLPLYAKVLRTAARWGSPDNLMFVTGATHPEKFAVIREWVPEHFLLVPGIGAQGGDLAAVCKHGRNPQVGLLVNASRDILYAGDGPDFADKAREAALRIQQRMAYLLPPPQRS